MSKPLLVVQILVLSGALSDSLWAIEPTVTIHATHPSASEVRSAAGTFAVTRTGPTNFPLLVFFRLSGTAVRVEERQRTQHRQS